MYLVLFLSSFFFWSFLDLRIYISIRLQYIHKTTRMKNMANILRLTKGKERNKLILQRFFFLQLPMPASI